MNYYNISTLSSKLVSLNVEMELRNATTLGQRKVLSHDFREEGPKTWGKETTIRAVQRIVSFIRQVNLAKKLFLCT